VDLLYPQHLYFDPGLPWVPERQPRFWVKEFDGTWTAVGPGKPPNQGREFQVPTPMGYFRDLTVAEYESIRDQL
jgi:hypothetical protein